MVKLEQIVGINNKEDLVLHPVVLQISPHVSFEGRFFYLKDIGYGFVPKADGTKDINVIHIGEGSTVKKIGENVYSIGGEYSGGILGPRTTFREAYGLLKNWDDSRKGI